MSSRGKILVIDDDLHAAMPMVHYLTAEGFEVQHADNGGRGVQAAQRSKPDLVLCDMLMPGMSGMETLKMIKAELPQTVIIVLSGIQGEEMTKAALSAGAHSYITKPINLEELKRNVIEQVFK